MQIQRLGWQVARFFYLTLRINIFAALHQLPNIFCDHKEAKQRLRAQEHGWVKVLEAMRLFLEMIRHRRLEARSR
jgi:hypothetical protein